MIRLHADYRHRRSVRQAGQLAVQFTESQTPYVFYGHRHNRENTIQAGSLVKIRRRADR